MKAKFLLFFLIFTFNCSISKNIDVFNTVKKEYAGTVSSSFFIKIPFNNYTLIETEISSIPIRGKIEIKVGTKCYYYYIIDKKTGKEILMVIWEHAKKGYVVM
jgi:hypothetical protein